MTEEALCFGRARSLVGVITDPPEEKKNADLPAIVFLNAGLIHHVGPNRLYVKLARNLADAGYVVFRFDFSGIGDSDVRNDNLPFEKCAIIETKEAMDYLHALRGIERFVLVGLCSGALNSFRTACHDARAVGAVLINPQGFGGQEVLSHIVSRRVARDYWKTGAFRPEKWLKVIAGKANYRAMLGSLGFQLKGMLGRGRKVSAKANTVVANFRQLIERNVRLLLIYTEGDIGFDYLEVIFGRELQEWQSAGKLGIEIIPRSDHTTTLLRSQRQLLAKVEDWAKASL